MNKKYVTAIIGGLILIVSAAVVHSQSIRPVASRVFATTQKAPADSKYSALLVKYLKSIEGMERALLAEREKEYQESLAAEQAGIVALAKDEANILRGLQEEKTKRKSKKLDFEGEVYENSKPFIFGSSPASARIVKALIAEEAFRDVGDVIAQLQANATSDLCKEWIAILEEAYRNSKKDSDLSRLIERLLYRSGQTAYRDALINQIENNGNAAALEAFLFARDPKTGIPEPIINTDTLHLMKCYADKKYSPGVRATCAHYALEVRDYALSAAICRDLLAETYLGIKTRKVTEDVPMQDIWLGHARRAAMLLMFYGHKNEEAFLLIYNRAHVEEQERSKRTPSAYLPLAPGQRPASVPATIRGQDQDEELWVSFTSYPPGKHEVDTARSLISTLKEQGDDHEK